ncbi:MAG: nucleotide exchange factor GrpE [Deltaproteobacteria bacterium]|nr:nucleotide exchange factor GrpE [Deltaproteobacteria bacterium]
MSRTPAAPPPGGPPSRGPSFTIDVDDDLLAAALAAVEQRDRSRARRVADPRELAAAEAALAADLSVDESELDEDDAAPALPRIPGWAADPGERGGRDEDADLDAQDDDLPEEEATFALPSRAPRVSATPTWTDADPLGGGLDSLHARRQAAPDPDDDLLALWRQGDGGAAPAEGAPGEDDDEDEEVARLEREAAEAEAELIAALSQEVRELRRAEELGSAALHAALEREQALQAEITELQAQADAGRTELSEAQAELGRVRAAAQRLVREKRAAEEALQRASARTTRAEDAKAEADRVLLENAKLLGERAEQIVRLERDLERAHERRKRELEEQRRRDATRPLRELLPVLDNLQLAVQHAQGEQGAVVSGLRMIAEQLHRGLKKLGLEAISADPGSPFNPEQHEALQRIETDTVPDGSIAAELQPGYTFEGRLLRAARVSVAVSPRALPAPAGPAAPGQPPSAAEAEPAAGLEGAARTEPTTSASPSGSSDLGAEDEAPTGLVHGSVPGLVFGAVDADENVLDLDTIDLPADSGLLEAPPATSWDLRRPPGRTPAAVPLQDDDTQRTDATAPTDDD